MTETNKIIKKSRRFWLYLLPMFCVLLLPGLGMIVRPTTQPIGNTVLAELPSLYLEDGSFNREYLQQLGGYYEDHFAFRPEMVTADSVLKKEVFGISSQESVIAGTDGWLYYEATLDDFQHKNNVSDRILFNEAHNVRLMQEYVRQQGAEFVFTIAPNKNTLYPEHMPERYKIRYAKESDFDRLIPFLNAEGVNYVDLDALFRETPEVLYYARDSHWTEKGAVLAYNALLDAAEHPHETYEETEPWASQDYYGDLGAMLYPSGAYPEEQLHYLDYPVYAYVTETESVEENEIVTINPSAEGSLLMFRDSFGNSLLPYMAQVFYSASFSKTVPYRMTDAADGAADVVIVERVERHLPTLSSVAPLMPGILRDPETEGIMKPETPCAEAEQSVEGEYYVFTGKIDPDIAVVDARIYLELTDLSNTRCYEAFCTNTRDSDFAFTLYVPAAEIDTQVLKTRVLVQNAEQWILGTEIISPEYEKILAEREAEKAQRYAEYVDVTEETAELLYAAETELEQVTAGQETALRSVPESAEEPEEQKEAAAEEAEEVSRVYIEDCGRDTGYWEITYSDGHVEYVDD